MFAILATLLLLAVPASARADTVFEAFPGLPDFAYPVAVVDPMDGTRRLFVAELGGRIYVFQNDAAVSSRALFLDISAEFTIAGEGGLLGLAFDPSYATSGHCYVTYTVDNPRREILARFTADPVNPDTVLALSKEVIKEIPKASLAHNGGHIVFGPDGYLYWGLGDDQIIRHAQDLTQWNGKLLRIDADTPSDSTLYSIPPDNPFVASGGGVHPEIYAFGLRNPWRFSFDPPTGRLWLADVGHSRWEEIDIMHKGRNYGWSRMEGNVCYPFVNCDTTGLNLVAPLFVYPHPPGSGASVTGGYVYRGPSAPSMVGKYIYADYITGDIWALSWDGVSEPTNAHIDTLGAITSFGIDQDDELYCVSFDGNVYRMFSAPPPPPVPPRNAIVNVSPNPFRNQTTIGFELADAGRATLDVFDVAGRRIARISDASAGAGAGSAQWDGRNDQGEPVGSGVYFIRLSLDGNQADTRRLILLK
jgi:glucose/arabinose dehydrogenase